MDGRAGEEDRDRMSGMAMAWDGMRWRCGADRGGENKKRRTRNQNIAGRTLAGHAMKRKLPPGPAFLHAEMGQREIDDVNDEAKAPDNGSTQLQPHFDVLRAGPGP